VGVPAHATGGVNQPGVGGAMARASRLLEGAGATIVPVEMPHAAYAVPAYYLVATAEASSNLARFDGVRYGRRAAGAAELEEMYVRTRTEGFGDEVKRRIMLGTYALSAGYYDAHYLAALKTRRLVKGDYDAVFEGAGDFSGTSGEASGGGAGPACHVVLTPTSIGPAFKIGEKMDDPIAMYTEDTYTAPVNMAGLPAVSLPAGVTEAGEGSPAGLPIGLQLTAGPFAEVLLLRVARLLGGLLGFSARAPGAGQRRGEP